MSGIEVRDAQTNALLMTQNRETLVGTFARHGYRTIAWMPGLWYPWPEGSFYKFDDIVGGPRFEYTGPPFGWWDIPDQVAFAKLDAVETGKPSRAPLFVFFPTISTHTPFSPTPPYQPDWNRLLRPHPFDKQPLADSYDETADWLNLGPGYVKAVSYSLRTIGGYLRTRQGRDFVMILVGDHQPPAAVSGERAPWDVPIHVIASRQDIVERLHAHGFQPGLRPERKPIGPMRDLLPILLSSFGSAN
jgi:phosphoglycerol transferase MdoB-like AlkP superfamily enzyme